MQWLDAHHHARISDAYATLLSSSAHSMMVICLVARRVTCPVNLMQILGGWKQRDYRAANASAIRSIWCPT